MRFTASSHIPNDLIRSDLQLTLATQYSMRDSLRLYNEIKEEEANRVHKNAGKVDTCFSCRRKLLLAVFPRREIKKPPGDRCCADCAQDVAFPGPGAPALPRWVLDKVLRFLNSVELVQADMTSRVSHATFFLAYWTYVL